MVWCPRFVTDLQAVSLILSSIQERQQCSTLCIQFPRVQEINRIKPFSKTAKCFSSEEMLPMQCAHLSQSVYCFSSIGHVYLFILNEILLTLSGLLWMAVTFFSNWEKTIRAQDLNCTVKYWREKLEAFQYTSHFSLCYFLKKLRFPKIRHIFSVFLTLIIRDRAGSTMLESSEYLIRSVKMFSRYVV